MTFIQQIADEIGLTDSVSWGTSNEMVLVTYKDRTYHILKTEGGYSAMGVMWSNVKLKAKTLASLKVKMDLI